VIVLRSKLVWQGMDVDVVVPAGADPGGRVITWMQNYGEQFTRPFIYQQDGLWHGYGPPAFQHDVAQKVGRGEKLW